MAFWKWFNELWLRLTVLVWSWVCTIFSYFINHILNSLDKLYHTAQFKVYIYKGELEKIRDLVLQKDNIETGGDLFGLWMDKRNVVVQFVLGPGRNCRRTATSFYQDVDYLAEVGEYITKNHGLCNIGQWHSHHRLDLPRPSIGDEDTVWNNMPGLGLDRYVVFIATIRDSGRASIVDVNCFLFEIDNETKRPLSILKGEICEMQNEQFPSPVRVYMDLITVVNSGMEDEKEHEDYSVIDKDM